LLELHSILNTRQINFIKKYKGNLLLAPISKKIKSQCERIAIPHAFAPMGIKSSFLASNLEIENYLATLRERKFLEFVYVGKLFPGGISKGVETLISIAKFAQKNLLELKIKVIGGNETEIVRFREVIARENVHAYFELKGQLPHDLALRELKNSDIIILTKSTDPNYAGFPLKAIEALASGRLIVVEENDAYKDAFHEDSFVIWFNKDVIGDIFLQIQTALNDDQLDLKLMGNVEFAKSFTWMIRTQYLLTKISEN
jgi:glycosyltransferase involved in cell wall biosynthesis